MVNWHKRKASGLLHAAALLSPFGIAWLAAPLILRDHFPICLLRRMTGLPCPFCGLTRALACATHGDFEAACRFNLLWIPLAVILLLLATLHLSDALGNRQMASQFIRAVTARWVWVASALAAFGIGRILIH